MLLSESDEIDTGLQWQSRARWVLEIGGHQNQPWALAAKSELKCFNVQSNFSDRQANQPGTGTVKHFPQARIDGFLDHNQIARLNEGPGKKVKSLLTARRNEYTRGRGLCKLTVESS